MHSQLTTKSYHVWPRSLRDDGCHAPTCPFKKIREQFQNHSSASNAEMSDVGCVIESAAGVAVRVHVALVIGLSGDT